MEDKLSKPYDPKETEARIYELWEKSGYFTPEHLPERHKDPFTIVLPPPNVTGTLHAGHAVMLAIEDILIRYKRMRGFRTLWIPGTDHAAIATQSKVEKEISKKEGKSRYDIGREELLKRIELFASESHDTIVSQCKRMGASLDWSREAFTLDTKRTLAVRTAFKRMYDDGLIYRGNRIVNWDPKGQTTIADDEVEHEERDATLYTFKYSKDCPIAISSTRPETKVGDTGIAVHPDDPRYKEFVGKTFSFIFAGEQVSVKVVADESVDPNFGTGALGVTPAHSKIDWDIAKKHGLPMKQVIDEKARMVVSSEILKGKKVAEAREIIASWLKEEGLLIKEEVVKQNVPIAERTGGIIEPLPKLQWFVDVNKEFTLPHSKLKDIPSGSKVTLKTLMKSAVESGGVKIIPDRFDKVYFHWIENLQDWCISRQIWYGHRVPVWYKGEELYVGIENPSTPGWVQDEDTLDTWFSSGLWTFSTLGWPEQTKDLEMYHPTDVLETGYDILFFWVARMILFSTYLLGDVPFKNVYLHGIVRTTDGKKMSKSLGNTTDPIEMIEKYGTDALRMSLIIGTGPGNDSRLSEDKLKAYKHFANKLWNITRFVLTNTENYNESTELTDEDKALLTEWKGVRDDITTDLENYRFYLAGEKLYGYAWHRFADVIIEESKEKLKGKHKDSRAKVIREIHKELITTLHPFMPYVTEEIWGIMGNNTTDLLMVEPWPNS